MQWNVLNYGRIRNNIKLQNERVEESTFQYQQTVLNAGREVEDALTAFLQAQEQAKYLEQTVVDAQRSVELVLLQFQSGVVDFNRVFNTQTTLLNAQDQLATTRGNIALQLIQVYKGDRRRLALFSGRVRHAEFRDLTRHDNAADCCSKTRGTLRRETARGNPLTNGRYMSRWRNAHDDVESVTAAMTASGQRSGISTCSPAPSKYTRRAISMA